MTYNYIFDTLAQYTTAKSAGGDIYNALRTSQYLVRCAVSHIREMGLTVIDTMNLIDKVQTLEVSDILLYRPADQSYYALKQPATWTTAPGTRSYSASDLANAGFIRVGYVYTRENDECIIGNILPSTYEFATINELPSGLLRTNGVLRGKVSPTQTFGNRGRAMFNGPLATANPSTSVAYLSIFPISLAEWNTAIVEGTTISYAIHGQTKEITPADFNGTYSDFINDYILGVYPDNTSTSAFLDCNGRKNTQILINSGLNVPAARVAYDFAIADVPDYGATKWWLPALGEMIKIVMSARKNGSPWLSIFATSTIRLSSSYYTSYTGGGIIDRTLTTQSNVLAISKFRIV